MSFLSKLFKKKKQPEAPQALRPPAPPLPPESVGPQPSPTPRVESPPSPPRGDTMGFSTPRVDATPPPTPYGDTKPLSTPHVDTVPMARVETASMPKPGVTHEVLNKTLETPKPAPATEPLAPLKPVTDSFAAPKPTVAHEQHARLYKPVGEAAVKNSSDPGVTAALGSDPRAHTATAESAKPSAQTPTATAPLEPGLGLSDAFFDDFLDDFDANFDATLSSGSNASARADGAGHGIVFEQSPVRELFADIAANYVRAVRNFMIELNRGDASKEWIDICQPAVNSIKKAAEKMELDDIYKAIDDFDTVLGCAAGTEGRMIGGEVRDELILAYFELVELMPQAFRLDNERDQRESIIIHSLIMQVPEVRKVTIDKLYGAGLTTLEVFFLAKPDDLGATAGIPEWLAAKIVDKFQEYRRDAQTVAPDAAHSAERTKLIALVTELRKLQEWYERASGDWSQDAAEEKKRLRSARTDTLMQINVVLAQLGEVELIHEIEKLPFERRIERVETYLSEGMIGEVPL
jgi:hypothetical protein